MEGLFKSLALQHMPANMQNIDRKKAGNVSLVPTPLSVLSSLTVFPSGYLRIINNIASKRFPQDYFLCFFSVPRPNMDKYVFLKVLENQEQVMIDPEYVLHMYL